MKNIHLQALNLAVSLFEKGTDYSPISGGITFSDIEEARVAGLVRVVPNPDPEMAPMDLHGLQYAGLYQEDVALADIPAAFKSMPNCFAAVHKCGSRIHKGKPDWYYGADAWFGRGEGGTVGGPVLPFEGWTLLSVPEPTDCAQ